MVENNERRTNYRREQQARKRREITTATERVCTPLWQARVTQRLGSAVDARLWAPRLRPCSIENCRRYAEVAQALLKFHAVARLVPGGMLYRYRMSRAQDTFEADLAQKLYAMSSAPARVAMVKVAKCLQVIGILCCVTADRDVEDCQCLQDFGQDLVLDELETELLEMAEARSWPAD